MKAQRPLSPRLGLPRFPAQRLLLVLALALLVLIALAWLLGSGRWQAPAPLLPDVATLAAEALVNTTPPPPDAVAIVAARPLFAPDRRPFAADAGPTPADADKRATDILDQAKLVGVLGSGTASVALLHTAEGSKRLRVGQTLHGWRLVAVDAGGAAFERELGDRENLRIENRQLPFVRLPQTLVGQPPRPRR